MEITWFGHSCFRLVERGMASVVTDPYDESLGYPALRLKADIVTISHLAPGHSNIEAVKGRTIVAPAFDVKDQRHIAHAFRWSRGQRCIL